MPFILAHYEEELRQAQKKIVKLSKLKTKLEASNKKVEELKGLLHEVYEKLIQSSRNEK